MITKAHVISFLTIVLLYTGVAIWKWAPDYFETDPVSKNESREHIISSVSRFWEYYDQATQLRSHGSYRHAAMWYSKALEMNQNHKDALYYAGSMYLMDKDFEKAKNYWNQLLQEEPNAPRTHLRLGTLHFCMDPENPHFNLERAYVYFSEAWQLNLEETGAPLLLAKIHLLNDEPEPAEELLSDILSVNGTNEQALFLMGFVNWRSGNVNEARQLLSRSRTYLNRDTSKKHLGEGATKSGNAMLLQDRFCDGLEVTLKQLIRGDSELSTGKIYSRFNDSILSWRDNFGIEH